MDKQLYILWNYDCDQPVIASEDEDLLKEYMCDFFMEDAYYDFCYRCFYDSRAIGPYTIAKEVWEDDLHYYLTYFDILGNELVIV